MTMKMMATAKMVGVFRVEFNFYVWLVFWIVLGDDNECSLKKLMKTQFESGEQDEEESDEDFNLDQAGKTNGSLNKNQSENQENH